MWPGHEYPEGGGPGPVAAGPWPALRLCRGGGCLGGSGRCLSGCRCGEVYIGWNEPF